MRTYLQIYSRHKPTYSLIGLRRCFLVRYALPNGIGTQKLEVRPILVILSIQESITYNELIITYYAESKILYDSRNYYAGEVASKMIL